VKVNQREKEILDKQFNDAQRKHGGLLSRIWKVQLIWEEKGHGTEAEGFLTWSAHQCRDYLQEEYKRLDTDGAMPKNVGPLHIRCQEMMGRASPMASPHPSDDEASVSDVREETDEDWYHTLYNTSTSGCGRK
jgi:hypothetical protein